MTETLRQREGDQPLPVPNDREDVQSLVMADLAARREVGIQRYGTALQPFNGRSALRDLYEELLDAACYARQRLVEDEPQVETERLADVLHEMRRHPDFEYETTSGQRKAWDDADTPPEGGGWERNRTTKCPEGWERFDYHEESYWRRKRGWGPKP